MKKLTLFAVAVLFGQCSCYVIKVPSKPAQPSIAPVGWLRIQKLMLPLFENICEESTDDTVLHLAQDFTLDSSDSNAYTKPDVVNNLANLKNSKGLLPKGEIFSEYNTSHINELQALYEIFFYAKDFDTFYKAACWARQNINCGLYIDALYLAVLNRRDTSKISIPAPFEILPNYFIQKDIIFKASSLLSGKDLTTLDDVRVENNAYILEADYTTEVNNDNGDCKMAYFLEDIGLNSYYYLRKLKTAPWLNIPTDVNKSYGEYLFLMMKQSAARYDMERYSKGLDALESFNLDAVVPDYNPMLVYSNGNEFSHRKFAGVLSDTDDVTFLRTIENNLAAVVDHLRQTGHNKTQILNHIIEIMVTSDKSYENIARRLLSFDMEDSERQFSVLEHYLTSMRDPIFWKINKKIVELIDDALKNLPGYSRRELYFPGVEILNVETKKLMTSFESFQFDVTDSLKTTNSNATFQVKIAQMRLNHKPFTIKLNISSLVAQKGYVKIYLGPKTLPGEFSLNKNSYILMDKFEQDLKRGVNIISRSSEEMKAYSNDFTSLPAIHKNVEDAEFGLDSLPLKDVDWQVGFPSRLVLPKGSPDGLPLQLFVFVAPITKSSLSGAYVPGNIDFNSPIFSAGYPLDLNVDEKQLLTLPNAFMKDITITHKGDSKSSSYNSKTGPRKWDSDGAFESTHYDYSAKTENYYKNLRDDTEDQNIDERIDKTHDLLSERPSFTYKNKQDTNNGPKMNQYKFKENFESKRDKIDNIQKEFQSKDDYSAIRKNVYKILEDDTKDKNIDYETDQTHDTSKISSYSNEKPYEKIHGILSLRPDFTYKKGATDYSAKRNQYKEKREKYGTKQSEYKRGNNSYDNLNESRNITSKIEKISDNKDEKEFPSKIIFVDDKNNIVYKNISENKNINTDKINAEKLDDITKEIVFNPVPTKSAVLVEEIIKYPTVMGGDSLTEIDDLTFDSDYSMMHVPVIIPETATKPVTVYDFLFNNVFEDKKVYE